MKLESVSKLTKNFNDYANENNGLEFWFARDLQVLLGYSKWENFFKIINKAKIACENSNQKIQDHFPKVRKKVELGSGAKREIEDIVLTRYACYLIAQNGDSRKEEIAFAQTYFAIQTRKQEIIEERIVLNERIKAREKLSKSETKLSKLIYERGVDDGGFANIRSKGDKSLFGGNNTNQMKSKLKIPKNRALADFLPTVTITAKNFATEITNFNVRKQYLFGENKITNEHVRNNLRVRKILLEDNIFPENLPPEEDIKKIGRRIKKSDGQLLKNK